MYEIYSIETGEACELRSTNLDSAINEALEMVAHNRNRDYYICEATSGKICYRFGV